MTSDSNRIRDALKKLEKATEQHKLNHTAKAYVLYIEALEEVGLCLFFDKDLEKNPKFKKEDLLRHYERAKEIRPSLSRTAEVGLGLARSYFKPSNVKLDDVGGLRACKDLLREAAIVPIDFPHFFTGNRKPWKAILLYGPPGTGKTQLANAIATEARTAFFSVSASNLVSKWMGESEKKISKLFQSARDEAPSIIFIDEIDSLCGPRGNVNENEASRRIKTEFLVQMQAVSNDAKNVLVLAATNTPGHLDPAMKRRFDKRIHIGLPDEEARKKIFELHIGSTPHNLSPEDFQYLARKTKDFSGSDISICVKDALYQPVRATLDAEFFREFSPGLWVVCKGTDQNAKKYTFEELKAKVEAPKIQLPLSTKADFVSVLKKQKSTVTKDEIDACEKFTEDFGIDG